MCSAKFLASLGGLATTSYKSVCTGLGDSTCRSFMENTVSRNLAIECGYQKENTNNFISVTNILTCKKWGKVF